MNLHSQLLDLYKYLLRIAEFSNYVVTGIGRAITC